MSATDPAMDSDPSNPNQRRDYTVTWFNALVAERDEAIAERDAYRQAALELHSEIRNGLAWIGSGCEPHVAHAAMLKTADRHRALLGENTEGQEA